MNPENGTSGTEVPSGPSNPFPPIPAARLNGFSGDPDVGTPGREVPETVGTTALDDLREQVEDYFDRSAGSRARGRVVALVGRLGMGKTHVAREITALLRERENPPPVWVIDEPVVDLGMVYRDRLMNPADDRNGRAAFEEVVTDYYSDVAAARLEQDGGAPQEVTRVQVAKGLRDRMLDPGKVVQAFNIDEELIHRDLQRHLSGVIEHRKFATALALLLDRGFKRMVWDWLAGGPPAEPLVDRGIRAAIDGIDPVFEMLAVFGFLYGRVGAPYVLVMDSLEKVFDWPESDRAAFLDAFERLVNVYAEMGGLLIFCVPPEGLGRFRPNLHERILQIWPTGLTRAQTADLVRAHMASAERAPAADPLAPFTPAAIDEIADLSHGIPRRILKMCWQAWNLAERADAPGGRIDESIVHDAVRDLYETASPAYVLSVIEDTLAGEQWRTEAVHDETGGTVDGVALWVRVGASARIAVLTVGSILVGAEVDRLTATVRAAREAFEPGTCEVLVIVNGHLSRRMRDRVARTGGTQPIVYDSRDFERRLRNSLRVLAERLERAGRGSAVDGLYDRIGTLATTQHVMLDHLQRMEARMERLAAGAPPRAAAAPATVTAPSAGSLPEPVDACFRRALEAVDVLFAGPADLRRLLGGDDTGTAPPGARPRRLTFDAADFQAMGVVALACRLIEAFREGVERWFDAVRSEDGGEPTRGHLDGLFVLCRSFEITAEVLPLYPLQHSAPRAGGPSPPGAGSGSASEAVRAAQRKEAEEILGDLAGNVRRAVLAQVSGPEPGAAR